MWLLIVALGIAVLAFLVAGLALCLALDTHEPAQSDFERLPTR